MSKHKLFLHLYIIYQECDSQDFPRPWQLAITDNTVQNHVSGGGIKYRP